MLTDVETFNLFSNSQAKKRLREFAPNINPILPKSLNIARHIQTH